MPHTIRLAQIHDATGIARVHVETWQSHYRGQLPDDHLAGLSVDKRATAWAESLSKPKPGHATFVVEEPPEILGFCSVGSSRDAQAPDNTGELYALYLSPSRQGQGTGDALMKAGLDFLRRQDFKRATLWVLKTNAAAIGFYEAQGWKADGAEKKDDRYAFVLEEIRYGVDL